MLGKGTITKPTNFVFFLLQKKCPWSLFNILAKEKLVKGAPRCDGVPRPSLNLTLSPGGVSKLPGVVTSVSPTPKFPLQALQKRVVPG